MSPSPYLTPKQAAEYMGLHYHTFISLAKAQGLKPDGKAGKRNRYLPTTLDRFMRVLVGRSESRAS